MRRKLLDWKEAADILGVSVRTLRRFVHDQGAPVVWRGARFYFDEDALIEWRAARLTPAAVGWMARKGLV